MGGGIYCTGSGPTITNCVITGNKAMQGAGIFAWRNSSPIIIDCTISENIGPSGGGVYLWWDTTATITNCLIRDNDGRGIYCWDCPYAEISNCQITDNGLFGIDISRSAVIISNCTISDNDGSGISCVSGSTTISNCLISGNTDLDGGGIRTLGITTIENSTITGNSAEMGGGVCCQGGETTIINSILWNNLFEDIYIWPYPSPPGDSTTYSPKLTVSYSCLGVIVNDGGTLILGEGNIDADPCFADPRLADPSSGDYHLKSQAGRCDPSSESWVIDDVTSPAIDGGDPADPIGYEPFPNGGIVNMGAYGGTGEASKSYFGTTLCETIVAGDINGDCKVDFLDFAFMSFHWLEDNSP